MTAGYPGAAPVLTGLSFRIDRGERVALRGPSGVGKSTVLAVVEKLLVPRSGEVAIGGQDLARLSRTEVLSRLSIVAQSTVLFSGSIADNLRLALPDATPTQLWDALAAANLADEVKAMDAGLDQPVGERGLALSGGQAQRISIARALLRDAPLLILDEPSSQVDLRSEALIADALRELTIGRSTLIVTHRPGILGEDTRSVHLPGGEVTA
ncbi:MAG: ATP-binding cassette domain-containing protein [Mycetocola sp.]